MTQLIQAAILGLVQGLTEFIPVSSSGHLILMHQLFGLEAGGLIFDVTLHIGTLLALIIFFHKDIGLLIKGITRRTEHSRLARLIAVATVPAVMVGAALQDMAESTFRSSRLVAINLIVVAVVMLWAEHYAKRRVRHGNFSVKQALVMGSAQALAIVPGVSRSGSTIIAGVFTGLDRVTATRFSFLMAIPITTGAIVKVLLDPRALAVVNEQTGVFLVGILASAVSGVLAIRFLMKFLAKRSLATFAYYRIGLGALLLLGIF